MNQRKLEAVQYTLLSITTWFTILNHSLHSQTFQRPYRSSTPASVRVNKCGDSPRSDVQIRHQAIPKPPSNKLFIVYHATSINSIVCSSSSSLFLPATTLQLAHIFKPSYHILIAIREAEERLGFQNKHTDIALFRRKNSKTKRTSSF
jgi:hypothetical protein